MVRFATKEWKGQEPLGFWSSPFGPVCVSDPTAPASRTDATPRSGMAKYAIISAGMSVFSLHTALVDSYGLSSPLALFVLAVAGLVATLVVSAIISVLVLSKQKED